MVREHRTVYYIDRPRHRVVIESFNRFLDVPSELARDSGSVWYGRNDRVRATQQNAHPVTASRPVIISIIIIIIILYGTLNSRESCVITVVWAFSTRASAAGAESTERAVIVAVQAARRSDLFRRESAVRERQRYDGVSTTVHRRRRQETDRGRER